MKHIIGHMRAGLASASILIAAPVSLADASRWVESLPGGPDVALSLASVEQAETALAALARTAHLDWLPTTHRLLIATNLLPGTDTTRPFAIAFEPGHDDAGSPHFVAVIPADRPAILAANFEALPSTDHPGLFAFTFAERDYLARVLPDNHLAISDSAGLLNSLQDDRGNAAEPAPDQADGPIRLTLRGDRSIRLLQSLITAASDNAEQTPDEPMFPWPEDMESIEIQLAPSAESLDIGVRLVAQPRSELASQWNRSSETPLEPIPLPNTEAVLVVQGSMNDGATRAFFLPLAAQLFGLTPDAMPEADSFALLLEPPANMMDFSGLSASLALTSANPEQTRAELRQIIASLPGASLTPDASTRVGVAMDHFSVSAHGRTPRSPDQRGGLAGFLPQPRSGENGSIDGRMFSRNGRVYLSTASTQNGLDRLIAFGPDSTNIESSGSTGDWMARLPENAGGRLALNIESTVRMFAAFSSMVSSRLELPDEIAPIVAAVRTGDGSVRVNMIIPADTLKVIGQVWKSAASMRPQPAENPE